MSWEMHEAAKKIADGWYSELEATRKRNAVLERENAELRERITTQKQTIQAYRDESREWREVAERAQAENAKLRELVRAAWRCIHTGASCSDCRLIAGGCTLQTAMRELGVEVG